MDILDYIINGNGVEEPKPYISPEDRHKNWLKHKYELNQKKKDKREKHLVNLILNPPKGFQEQDFSNSFVHWKY